MEKARDNSSMEIWKNREQTRRLLWKHEQTKRKSTLPHWWANVTSKCGVGTQVTEVFAPGDIVKDDWSSCSFYWTGLSASQKTAAKIMDVIARLPGRDGQAAECSICVYSGTIGGCSQIAQHSQIGMSRCWDTSSTTQNGANHGANIEDPVVPLERNLYGPTHRPSVGKTIRRSWKTWMGVPNWECMFVHQKQGLFCQYVWMTSKWQENGTHVEKDDEKMWTLTNLHHFLTMYTWDVLIVNANRMEQLLNSIRRCLNHVFLLEQQKNYPDGKNVTHKPQRGPTTWKDMLKHALRDTANWRTRKWSNFTKFRILVWMTTNSSKEELGSVGELSEVCSQIVLTCLYLARIRRPDILWSVNKLAKIDSGMWQTTSQAYFLHSSHKRFPTMLSCGKHGTALQTGFVSRPRLCWRSWGLEINLRWSLV